MLVVSNVRDTTGEAAAAELADRRLLVRAALLGWVPETAAGEAVAFAGGRLLQFREARLWWTDEWRVTTDLTINPRSA